MVKIISYNVNGIRAAIGKGFLDWLKQESPDVIHIQETKAMREQIDTKPIEDLGYNIYWFAAEKKGYSGVATFTKQKPQNVTMGIGAEPYDSEGRFIRLDFENCTLINSYFPSGTTGDVRQEVKESYLEEVLQYTNNIAPQVSNIILSGDYNICHKAIDINNPVRNKNTSGFLPQEREWMDRFVASGFVDSFREFNTAAEQYSWWSYRAGARARNVGWRIDYNMISTALKPNLANAYILPQVVHSDHCPVVVELNIEL